MMLIKLIINTIVIIIAIVIIISINIDIIIIIVIMIVNSIINNNDDNHNNIIIIIIIIIIIDNRKGTNGVGANGVHANFRFLTAGLFGCTPVNLLLSSQKCQGRIFFPNLSKFITFASAPLVSTPFVRDQGTPIGGIGTPVGGYGAQTIWYDSMAPKRVSENR